MVGYSNLFKPVLNIIILTKRIVPAVYNIQNDSVADKKSRLICYAQYTDVNNEEKASHAYTLRKKLPRTWP